MHRRQFMTLGAASLAACATHAAGAIRGEPMSVDVEFQIVAGAPHLQLRRRRSAGLAVLYVHGATFPSALSVGYRFADGRSWEDDFVARGFDAWALDFEGYGDSERPAAFDRPADKIPQVLRSAAAAEQIARAVLHIQTERRDDAPIAVVAHSWGTIPAAKFITEHPGAVSRLVLFGPILTRIAAAPAADSAPYLPDPLQVPAWRLLTVAEQLTRFKADVPPGMENVLAEPELAQWGPKWLATDAAALGRTPPAVQIPGGPQADILAAWRGAALYDPARLACPTLVVRGEWDSLCTDDDVARFFATRGAATSADVVIPRATHLMHLEDGRFALWAATQAFLKGGDPIAAAQHVRPV